MTTAKNIVTSASQYIGVKRTGIDLTDEQLQIGTDVLREWLLELQADGIVIPFDLVFDADDELNEYDWSTSFMKMGLAIRLCPIYTIEPSVTLMRQFRSAKHAVYGKITDMGPMQKSPLLPKGQGNQWHGRTDKRFYTNEDKVAIETGSGTTLVDDEGDTIVRKDPQNGIL